MDIANTVAPSQSLDLHISIFVTCLCDPSAVPPIPNSDVTVFRPSVTELLRELVTPPDERERERLKSHTISTHARLGGLGKSKTRTSSSSSDEHSQTQTHDNDDADTEDEHGDADLEKCMKSKLQWVGLGGGVAVCASGPESLIRESQNAVARLGVVRGLELGGVGLHTELFAM